MTKREQFYEAYRTRRVLAREARSRLGDNGFYGGWMNFMADHCFTARYMHDSIPQSFKLRTKFAEHSLSKLQEAFWSPMIKFMMEHMGIPEPKHTVKDGVISDESGVPVGHL